MRQHLLQVDYVGVPPPNVAQVTGVCLLVLVSQQSAGTMVLKPAEKLSTIEARTHPDVVHPVIIVVSIQCLTSQGLRGVS